MYVLVWNLSHSISLWSVFFYTCWESVLCMYLDDTLRWLTSVVALTASCQWMVDGSWTWSSERVRGWGRREHIRVSVIPMWENIDQSHVALFMRFLQIQMAQHRQSISSQRKITREFSCNKKCILIQKWKDEILAECRVLAVRTVNVSGSVCLTWCW